jgi:hypothetical protein
MGIWILHVDTFGWGMLAVPTVCYAVTHEPQHTVGGCECGATTKFGRLNRWPPGMSGFV